MGALTTDDDDGYESGSDDGGYESSSDDEPDAAHATADGRKRRRE